MLTVSRRFVRPVLALLSLTFGLGVAEGVATLADGTLEFPTDGRRFSTRAGEHGTNRRGLHERELAEVPPTGVRRFVVLGDSMTWGTGTAAQAWPRLAETHLGPPWESVNLSHYGYDAEQSLATLQTFGWRYGPDAVVFATYGNDLVPTELITVGDAAMPAWVGGDGRGLGRWSLGRRFEGAVRARGFAELENPERDRAALVGLRDAAAAAGVPLFVVVLHPHVLAEPDPIACDRQAGAPDRCAGALARARSQVRMLEELAIPHLDILAALQAGPARSWFGENASDWEHPSPEGHALIGVAVAEWLQPLLPAAPAR
jgi:lysophospholipase L1-like esterase